MEEVGGEMSQVTWPIPSDAVDGDESMPENCDHEYVTCAVVPFHGLTAATCDECGESWREADTPYHDAPDWVIRVAEQGTGKGIDR
jgi:hypothetical protein